MKKYLYKFLEFYYLFTFIGTVIHEFAHEQAVVSRNLEVTEVDYFSLSGSSLGYVKHESPRTYMDMFIIGLAPILVNTIVSICCFIGVFIVYSSSSAIEPLLRYSVILILSWIGISSSLHAFPSSTDVKNIINVKKLLWDISEPHIKDKVTTELKDISSISNIVLSLIAFPVWLLTSLYHILKYIAFHPTSAVTVPFIYGLYGTIYLKYIGLHIFYTIGLVYLSQEVYLMYGF